MAMHSEQWFPTVIWSTFLDNVDILELKKFAYDRKRNDIGRTISNVSGYQSSDIRQNDCTEIDKLVKILNKEIYNCCEQISFPPLKINNLWININPPGAYNLLHNHQGSLLSGVFYVDSTTQHGNIEFERGDNAEYFLPKVIPRQTYFNLYKATYAARTNALLIFPSWVKHSVLQNQAKNDRISISFNYGLE